MQNFIGRLTLVQRHGLTFEIQTWAVKIMGTMLRLLGQVERDIRHGRARMYQ